MSIIQNALKCLKCDTIILSTYPHDYKTCKCGKTMVDGGNEYLKCSSEEGLVEELYLWDDSSSEDYNQKLVWGTRGLDNNEPVVFKKIKDLETFHIQAILRTQVQISEMRMKAFEGELRRRKIDNIIR
jgi:hypothetical protein